MVDFASLTQEEIGAIIKTGGFPPFRAKQIFHWIHQKHVGSFAEMTNLPGELIRFLEGAGQIYGVQIQKKLVSTLDHTVKYLYGLHDGESVEAVFMEYHHGNSLCISTQVGCKMGCTFCASTIAGFVRNLTAGEMLAQIDEAERERGKKISNVVLMGIGEPLDNYDQTLRFLTLLSNPDGRGMSLRNVTLSTCGVVPMIQKLMEEKLGLTLAVSLHAPNDNLRRQTMPISRQYPLEELLATCRAYTAKTGRRITFEYALIAGVNDSEADAKELGARLKGMLCHVNLIPVNPVAEREYQATTRKKAEAFLAVLEGRNIPVTIRRTIGADISAACGQLRREGK